MRPRTSMPARERKDALIIAAACLGIFVLGVQLFRADASSLAMFPPVSVRLILLCLVAVSLQMAGHLLRAKKQQYLLRRIRSIRTREVFKGQMIGFLFNTILPFRIGEVFRAHYIGKAVSISRAAVFATILFERCIDAFVLGTVGAFFLFFVLPGHSYLLRIVLLLLVSFAGVFCVLIAARAQQAWMLRVVYRISALFNDRVRDRFRFVCWSAIYCLKNVITRERLLPYFVLTGAMWILYFLSTLVLAVGFLSDLPFVQQLLSMAAAYFGVAVPSGPAYLGAFREVFVTISTESTRAAFAFWLLQIVPTTLFGLILIFPRPRVAIAKEATTLDVLRNKLYRDTDITKEFSQFLDSYFVGDEINRILTSAELADRFRVLRTFKGASNAQTILAWQEGEIVVKKIILRQYLDKLHAQYVWLRDRAALQHLPRALHEHRDHPEHYAIDIEYRDSFIPFFDFVHSSSVQENRRMLQEICQFVDDQIHVPKRPVVHPRRLLDDYIRTKVLGKVGDAANAHLEIAHLITYDAITVNGREMLNFHTVIDAIIRNPQAMADLAQFEDCPLHGDFTIDNILVDPTDGDFLLLDPNNENTISDPVTDYAKLMQSVHSGYEFLLSLPSCRVENDRVHFEERRSAQYDHLYQDLDERLRVSLSPVKFRALLFHEAVHYCRLLTYKVSINPKTAPAFYCVAVRLFNDFIEQYEQ